MTPGDRIRLVPKDDDPYDETVALIERLGWRESEDYSDENFEWVAADGTLVRWVVDGDTDVAFFVVEGPKREDVAGEIESSIEMLRPEDFEDYLAQFQTEHGLMPGLYKVAAAAPQRCDPRVLALFERYMADEDPLIRRVALIATSITGWPEFAEPVERRLDDPDADVRSAAEATLRALRS